MDSNLAPAKRNKFGRKEKEEPQGVCALHYKDGWTAISFWDRTGDSRGNSNSTFFIEGTYDFEAMKKMATEQYPEIISRFNFELKLFERRIP